ncbi:MAG: AAA family ATPase [Campylobacterales bacterium]|nr:AAA family ATPase [Campylobacterales bacterium]
MNYVDITLEKLHTKSNVFLTGGAGVGKTTITNAVIAAYEEEGKKVAKLASTGMAATLIGGQTLHSFFDLGISASIDELQRDKKFEIKKKVKKLIGSMSLIVIDEISMVSASLFEMIALRLEQAEYKGRILIVGDFLQLPPVVKAYEELAFAFESVAWSEFAFEKIELTHIYRTDDVRFIELLKDVRFGYVDEDIHNHLNEYIKPLPYELTHSTFLFGKNISANYHNRVQLDSLEGELVIKEAQLIKHIQSVDEREIERFVNDARIEQELELKVGAPVLFTRNAWNYFNGERGEIVNIDTNYVYVRKSDGKVIKLEPLAQSKTEWKEKSVNGKQEYIEESRFTIYQYPIKLAFAITIHKSQGMSIENLIIQTNEIFAPSQFYVALSRSANPKQLILIAPSRQWYELIYANEKVMHFVRRGA